MSDYTQTTTFATLDGTAPADSGAKFDTELSAISTAIASKYDNGDVIPVANGGTGASTAATARSNLGLDELATQDTVLGAFIRDEDGDSSTSAFSVSTKSFTLSAGDKVILFGTGEWTTTGAGVGEGKFSKSAGTATVVFDHDNAEHHVEDQVGSAGTFSLWGATIATCTVGGTATFTWGQVTIQNRSAHVDYQIYAIVLRGA